MSVIDRPIALVARREVSEGFRSKGFWILLAVSVVAVAAIIIIANLAGGSDESSIDLAVVGQPGDAAIDRYDAIGAAIGTQIDVVAVDDDAAARDAVDTGDADLALLDGASAIVVDEPIDDDTSSDLVTVVNVLSSDIALTEGLTEAGLSPEEITAALSHEPPTVESLHAGDSDDDDGSRVGTAIVINIALFLLLQTYGGWVVSGVTREKASRVVEVLLSTLTARQLMFGKIIGIGTLALLHAGSARDDRDRQRGDRRCRCPGRLPRHRHPRRCDLVPPRLRAVLLCVRRHRVALQSSRRRSRSGAPDHAAAGRRLHHRLLGGGRHLDAAVGARLLPADRGAVHAGALRHRGGSRLGDAGEHGDHRRHGLRRRPARRRHLLTVDPQGGQAGVVARGNRTRSVGRRAGDRRLTSDLHEAPSAGIDHPRQSGARSQR